MKATIVGAGVIGTFYAYHLALKGFEVKVFEKDPVPMEATVRNFGQVVPSGFEIGRWHHYGRYSTQLYKEIQAKRDIGIRNNGSLYVASDDSEMAVLEEMASKFHAVDYASELWNKQDVLNFNSNFKSDYVKGALFFKQEVSAESRMMIQSVQQYLEEAYSIQFFYNTAVIGVESKNDQTELTTALGEKHLADKTFVCNGRDFKFLFPSVFSNADIEVCKLQMMSTNPVDFTLKGNILTGLSIRRYESFKSCSSYNDLDQKNSKPHLTDKGIHILFKQRRDGSLVLGDSHTYADVNKSIEQEFDELNSINDLILEESKHILNLPNLKVKESWSGFYSQMKTEEGIFEKTIDENIHITTAIGGKGMTASAGYTRERVDVLT